MTDADVDGSHIRTLLLTFFFRQMPELIERGYIYIAQPPLYKITRNKKDVYCKDNEARNEFLLGIASERTKLILANGTQLTGEDFKALLKNVIKYEARLEKMVLRKDPRVVDAIVQGTTLTPELLKDADASAEQLDGSMDYIQTHHPELSEWLERNAVKRSDDPEHSAKRYVFHTEINGSPRETVIDTAFLSSPEFRDLAALKASFAAFGPAPYTLQIGDLRYTGHTYQEVLKKALDDAQTGLSQQRYKGLGEMNPEQLQETTMDSGRRTLLQVKVSDAIEAEKLFSLLMGEEVEPRRDFIEKHALEAQLDT
jgi:DNA gyrase subunit B